MESGHILLSPSVPFSIVHHEDCTLNLHYDMSANGADSTQKAVSFARSSSSCCTSSWSTTDPSSVLIISVTYCPN